MMYIFPSNKISYRHNSLGQRTLKGKLISFFKCTFTTKITLQPSKYNKNLINLMHYCYSGRDHLLISSAISHSPTVKSKLFIIPLHPSFSKLFIATIGMQWSNTYIAIIEVSLTMHKVGCVLARLLSRDFETQTCSS